MCFKVPSDISGVLCPIGGRPDFPSTPFVNDTAAWIMPLRKAIVRKHEVENGLVRIKWELPSLWATLPPKRSFWPLVSSVRT